MHFQKILIIFYIIFISSCAETNDPKMAIVYSELDSLKTNIELFNSVEKNKENEEILFKISFAALKDLIVIRNINPNIDHIKGLHLETLCRLTLPENQPVLLYLNKPEISKIAIEYLDSIKSEIQTEMEQAQKTFKGKNCHLTP